MHPKYLAVVISILIAFFVLDLIRRQKMTFKYSLFWLVTTSVVVIFTLNDRALYILSDFAGFSLPSNFVFFLFLVFFIFLSLILTIYVNEQNNRTETLAQTLAILECEIQDLKKNKR